MHMQKHAYTRIYHVYTLESRRKEEHITGDIVDGHVIIISLEWLLSNWNIRLTLED